MQNSGLVALEGVVDAVKLIGDNKQGEMED